MRGFDAALYEQLETRAIMERTAKARRLYLEVGGHLFFDAHASRVLPGFDPSAKLRLLQRVPVEKEVVLCAHAELVVSNGHIQSSGLSYRESIFSLLRSLSDAFPGCVNNLVLTRCEAHHAVFLAELSSTVAERFPGVHVHLHRKIEGLLSLSPRFACGAGYPAPEQAVRGFADNSPLMLGDAVKLVIVAGVQANSGKLGTCLSQLHHEKTAIYSKLELFPIWNLPVEHAVNRAYEAATADIGDVVCPDPFHTTEKAINYNRDVEAFPILRKLMETLLGVDSPLLRSYYLSPTSMGLNFAGSCITDDAVCSRAAVREIAHRTVVFEGDPKAKQRCLDLLHLVAEGKGVGDVLPATVLKGSETGTLETTDGAVFRAVDAAPAAALIVAAFGCQERVADVQGQVWRLTHADDVIFGHEVPVCPLAPLTVSDALWMVSASHKADVAVARLYRAYMHLARAPTDADGALLRKLGVTFSVAH